MALSDESINNLTERDRTRYAISEKMKSIDRTIIQAIKQNDQATVAHFESKRSVYEDRYDAAKDATNVIDAATVAEVIAIRDAVNGLDKLIADNKALRDIINATTELLSKPAGTVKVKA